MATSPALADVRAEIDDAWKRLWNAQARLSEADMARPGLTGAWSGKDVLTHIGHWSDTCATVVFGLADGTLPRGFTHRFRDEDAVNAEWAAADKDLSVAEVRKRCEAGHRRLRKVLDSLDDTAWENERVRRWVIGSTIDHYSGHLKDFERAGAREA